MTMPSCRSEESELVSDGQDGSIWCYLGHTLRMSSKALCWKSWLRFVAAVCVCTMLNALNKFHFVKPIVHGCTTPEQSFQRLYCVFCDSLYSGRFLAQANNQ
jgi:hypothetical protein